MHIRVIDEHEAEGECAAVYEEYMRTTARDFMPAIIKCFSHRPDFMRQVLEFSWTVHFTDGHLSRRIKEAIATYVSALNACPY